MHINILYYIINIVCLLDVSATVLAILREMHYKDTLQKPLKNAKYKTLSFKIYILKYVLKYKIQSTEHLAELTTSLLLYLDGDTLHNSQIEHFLHT
jgi:hypothetical protein